MEHIVGTWHTSAHAGMFCISIERSSLIRLLDETYEFFCCDVQIAINIGNEDNSTPIRSFEVHIVRLSVLVFYGICTYGRYICCCKNR